MNDKDKYCVGRIAFSSYMIGDKDKYLSALQEHISQLQEEVERLRGERDRLSLHLADSYKTEDRQRLEIAELRRIKFKRFNEEECWIFEGTIEELDSLVCPVVISASKLRSLLQEK